jgi:FkbM family methyltransferase
MKRLMLATLRFCLRSMTRLIPKLPSVLEYEMRLVQGKGAGAETIFLETTQALSFLGLDDSKNLTVLDIGANIGNYTQALVNQRSNAQIFAFEPSKTAQAFLEMRFKNNKRISLLPLALSDEEGIRKLWAPSPGSGLASLSKRKLSHSSINFDHFEEVEVTTLDKWNETWNLSPDLIKLDVEGHELSVLNGAKKILESTRVVQFEFGGANIDTKTYFQDFWYFFKDRGFRIYRIAQIGPIEIEMYSESEECFLTTNFLAVKIG